MAALKFENRVYALKMENSDDVLPNFLNYADRFNLSTQHLLNTNRDVLKKACLKMCDNLWWSEIVKSRKRHLTCYLKMMFVWKITFILSKIVKKGMH